MKVCFVTGSRAEYGLLKPLIDELKNDNFFKVQILVTGAHLSHEFGLTYKEIEKDGNRIDEKIEMLLSSDTSIGISKAMGLGLISFSEAYAKLKPELIVVLGDRFEIFSAVSAALVSKIPVAHLHGGELTFGAYDESFRHAITKMSHLHFTSTKEYRKRVIQLGENPKTVFNVGALGLDNIKKIKLLSKSDLEKSLSFNLDKPFFIVTFHPVTLENKSAEKQTTELLNALEKFNDYKIIITKPNSDNDGRVIIKLIDEFVNNHKDRVKSFNSLGWLRYLSALKYAEMMIGNSSSGIIEMPLFKKPTVNIGDREKGRIFSESIIQCDPNVTSIVKAIEKGLDKRFRKFCNVKINTYGNGTTSQKIRMILKKTNLQSLVKKEFYDIPFNTN